MGPEGLVWETPFQVSGTFFMPSTQHWGLGENENLFLRRATPSTQKMQESPECSEAIRIEEEARGVSTTWKDFFSHKNVSVEKEIILEKKLLPVQSGRDSGFSEDGSNWSSRLYRYL